MGVATHILKSDDPGWNAWLDRVRHDFYHRSEYHAFAERMGEGQAELIIVGDEAQFIAWPYLVRDIAPGLRDATSVYGYTGPVGLALGDLKFRHKALEAVRSAWAERGIISVFTRMHPLLGNAELVKGFPQAGRDSHVPLFTVGQTVSMDTSLDENTRRMGYPQPLRQDIKRAEREGLRVSLDSDWYAWDRFRDIYRLTMERNCATGSYLFSDAYFNGIREALGEAAHLSVAWVGDEVAAALLFVVHETFAAAHLTGSNPALSRYSPLKALIDRTVGIAANLGADRLHLGAGRGGHADSLFAFKSRFSPDRHDFVLGRFVIDEPTYSQLTREERSLGNSDLNYFPAYRAPASHQQAAS